MTQGEDDDGRIRTAADLGEAIRHARRAAGLTQEQVAERIGTGRRVVVEIEGGKERSEIGIVLRLAAELGVALHTAHPAPAPAPTPGAAPDDDLDELPVFGAPR
jgi:HTH-type transcriptional regulator/antitoxin HipB